MRQKTLTKWLAIALVAMLLLSAVGCFGTPANRPDPTTEPDDLLPVITAALDEDFFRYYMNDESAFLKEFFDLGPSYFNLIEAAML
ncbi:MAG: hypothetical protein FWE69_04200 [Clostridiales bacterium]|nr:hypothetical protein [Clostridiales bacterium]